MIWSNMLLTRSSLADGEKRMLDLGPEEIILEPIDVEAVNALAKEFLNK